MIRGTLVALTLTLLAGSPSRAQDATGLETTVWIRGFPEPIKLDTMVIWNEVHASPGAAFSSAKRILDSLKIRIRVADSVRGRIHADFHIPSGTIAGHRRSWTVRCGSGLSGDYAEIWRFFLSYVVYVQPGKDGKTRIGSTFFGRVDPVDGVSKASMPCRSTGNMEDLLFKAVQLRTLTS